MSYRTPVNMTRTLLSGGLVVDPGSGTYGIRDLLVVDGKLKAVAPALAPFQQWKWKSEPLRVYDLNGCYVFPGMVDIHTHLRVPGQEHKEDLRTGTLSAAAGGFTTVVAMPNTNPCLDRAAVIRSLKNRISREARVRVELVAAITRGQKGERLVSMESLQQEGVVAFSDDGLPVQNAGLMQDAMVTAHRLGSLLVSHCEDLTLVRGGVIQEGAVSRRLGVPGIPGAAEEVMVARDLCLASSTGAHLHLAHVSTAGSVAMVRLAKERGIHVSAEVTPHHLVLTERDVLRHGTQAKVNPPLRSRKDREALRKGIRDGTLDAVASDHAPHHPDEKAMTMTKAPFGVIGFETTLPLMLSLVERDVVGLVRAVELLTTGPAKTMGLRCGTLSKGREADLVVVDPRISFTVNPETFQSKARNCPFKGRRLKGRCILTMVGGAVVHEEAKRMGRREMIL